MTTGASSNGQAATRLLGRWLKARRSAIAAADVSLVANPRARSRAMTQWQAAQRGGISLRAWRDVENGHRPPGPHVIDGVVRALNLDPVEEAYLRRLANAAITDGHPPPSTPLEATGAAASVVDNHTGPGYATDHRWNLIAANPPIRQAAPGITPGRNLLDWFFTDPQARHLLPNWEIVAIEVVGMVRAMQAHRPDDAWYETTMDRLAGDLWNHRLHLWQPRPVSTIRVRCRTGRVTELTATRVQLEGCDHLGLQIVLMR